MTFTPITREYAKDAGMVYFYTGVPCPVCGSNDLRRVSNGECRICSRRRSVQWAKDNPKKANARSARWRDTNREHVRAKNREYKKEHPEKNREYLSRLYCRERLQQIESAGRPIPETCEICGVTPTGDSKNQKTLHYDHDHKTGQFRGWICFNCNAALGHVRDNIDVLRGMIEYLERNNVPV